MLFFWTLSKNSVKKGESFYKNIKQHNIVFIDNIKK